MQTILALVALVALLSACGSPPVSAESSAAVEPLVTEAPAPLTCVTSSTRCASSPDPYKSEGCWDLRICNRAPLPGELTMACEPVASSSPLPRFFCRWDL